MPADSGSTSGSTHSSSFSRPPWIPDPNREIPNQWAMFSNAVRAAIENAPPSGGRGRGGAQVGTGQDVGAHTNNPPYRPYGPPSFGPFFNVAGPEHPAGRGPGGQLGSASVTPGPSPDVVGAIQFRDFRQEEARLIRAASAQVSYSAEYLSRPSYAYVIPVSPDVWLEPGYGFNTEARFPSVASGAGGGGSRSFGGGRGGSGRNGYALGLINWRI